jgi:hypothetical protein
MDDADSIVARGGRASGRAPSGAGVESLPPMTIVWVADFFADQVLGGAELTSQALMDASPAPVARISSRDLRDADVDEHHGALWVVDNILGVFEGAASASALTRVLTTQAFVRLEYDYNWCHARSPLGHRARFGTACDCIERTPLGPLYALLHGRARRVFYMSHAQRVVHHQALGALLSPRSTVLGSCFSPATVDRLLAVGARAPGHEWLVVSRWGEVHDYWKGAPDALSLARRLGLPVKTVGGLAYDAFLDEMASSRGLIYLPNDLDPSPRTVIEARVMGRRLIMNDNVLHKNEPWFSEGPPEAVAAYLRGLPARFWQTALA